MSHIASILFVICVETTQLTHQICFKLFGLHEVKLGLMVLSSLAHTLFFFTFSSVLVFFWSVGYLVWVGCLVRVFLKEIGTGVFGRIQTRLSNYGFFNTHYGHSQEVVVKLMLWNIGYV